MEYGDRCTIYRVGSNRFNFAWHGLKKANQICHSKHIDLIHATTFIAALPAGMLRRTTGIPTVLHVHEIYGKLRYRFLGPIM
ncbi:glycosyltransferase [Patescibacteria group bacterium]|nr:glycosyltransferase [Patescibacteria group bacterium]